jgi:hypothetical protein
MDKYVKKKERGGEKQTHKRLKFSIGYQARAFRKLTFHYTLLYWRISAGVFLYTDNSFPQ